MKMTKKVARRVLEVVDAGLCNGMGEPIPGQMCVEAAVCFAMGLPHGDNPECVSPALRALKIELNDKSWSSNEARAKGLRRLAIAQLRSKGELDDQEFARRCAELAIRKNVPIALRAAAAIHPEEAHKLALEEAAKLCESQGTESAAKSAAWSAANSAAWSAANSAESAANSAAKSAAKSAVWSAAKSAAWSAANSAESAAKSAVWSAANSAVWSAANSAESAAKSAAWSAAYDKTLADFAEDVVQILVTMKAPGCQYLSLTEAG